MYYYSRNLCQNSRTAGGFLEWLSARPWPPNHYKQSSNWAQRFFRTWLGRGCLKLSQSVSAPARLAAASAAEQCWSSNTETVTTCKQIYCPKPAKSHWETLYMAKDQGHTHWTKASHSRSAGSSWTSAKTYHCQHLVGKNPCPQSPGSDWQRFWVDSVTNTSSCWSYCFSQCKSDRVTCSQCGRSSHCKRYGVSPTTPRAGSWVWTQDAQRETPLTNQQLHKQQNKADVKEHKSVSLPTKVCYLNTVYSPGMLIVNPIRDKLGS